MTPLFQRSTVSALALTALLAVAAPAGAETFRWATTSDPNTMDPHAASSAPVLGFLNNVYEGLVRRDRTMAIEPALAVRWEALGDEGWRFHLREGVTFHNGAAFTADDVLFSYERAAGETSDVRSWFAPVTEVRVVDDFTIDFLTSAPNPIFPDSIANFMIMDRDWSEANGAATPATDEERYTTLNANGTGAFQLIDRSPAVRTVLQPFEDWWGEATHGITEAVYTPIQSDATMLAALIAGDVDLINPVPIQNVARLQEQDGIEVIVGEEARVMMLGFKHDADTLVFDGSANPFQDARVRRAVYHAINVDAINTTIMRGAVEPVAQLVTPDMRGFSAGLESRLDYNPDGARALLAEAGYGDGFTFSLVCPNDRYINDAAVCQAVVGMLAQVGITADLTTMPVANYWPELRADSFDMYLLGWSPGTFDHEHPIRFLVTTPNEERRVGSWNFGAFSNARVDELLPAVQSEVDEGTRQALLDEITSIYQDEVAYVPMYSQPILWGVRDGVTVSPRSDNFFILRWVTMN
ncbi:MAG: ABC transporter substrate-binding protein [Devosiaceae bacterium]|nr:ABC transporter substrate-binding protein [Devosiaceae bacterium MH13]